MFCQGIGFLPQYFFILFFYIFVLFCFFSVLLVYLYCSCVLFVFCAGFVIGTCAVKPAC
jgi:hypothetical protein